MLSRLDPDGDGVVTEDEFTQWAKEQALRVQHWEQRLEDVLSELSEQVEKSVDQDVLSERLARVETQLKQQISGAADELAEEIGEMRELTQKLAEQEKQKKIELLARRALGRIRNNLTLKAFTAWHTNTVERVRRQNLARRAIGRIRNVCMVAAFARWAGAVRSARKKRHDTQLEEQALQLQQVLSHLDLDGTEWAQVYIPLYSDLLGTHESRR